MRIGVFAALFLFFVFLTVSVFLEFTLRTFGTDGYTIGPANLLNAIEYFPSSSRLRFRLAQYYLEQRPPNLEGAEDQLIQARQWTPSEYKYPLMLGEIQLAQGNYDGAEIALTDALRLAPTDHVVHWRLANLQLATGRTEQALPHFRYAVNLNSALLPLTLDMLWRATDGNVASLSQIAGDTVQSKLKLASFLVAKSRPSEAVNVVSIIDADALKALPAASAYLNDLIGKGNMEAAYDLWFRMKMPAPSSVSNPIWNGDFAWSITSDLSQFDWQIQENAFAKIRIDDVEGHSDFGALAIDFSGRDTTVLDQEVRQVFMVHQNTKYWLSFFIKSEGFFSPATGPVTIVLSNMKGNSPSTVLSRSEPFPSGTYGWKEMVVDFVSPSADAASTPLTISVKRHPRFAYDEPTKGRIWLDDFMLRETPAK